MVTMTDDDAAPENPGVAEQFLELSLLTAGETLGAVDYTQTQKHHNF